MSQEFKLKFDEMRNNDPGKKETEHNDSFSSPGHVRNLCFAWPDGKMKFLNYAYLVSGEYLPDGSISLTFTSDTIIIKGVLLESLFEELINHIPKWITCTDERYNLIHDTGKPVVNEIRVNKNE